MVLYQKEPSKLLTEEDKKHLDQIKALPSHSPFTAEEEEQIIEGGLKDLEPDNELGFVTLTPKSGTIYVTLYTVLDKVFGARWERAKTAVEQEWLVNKFEVSYWRHKESVPWYKRIEGGITAIRRQADHEREQDRLTRMLEELRISTMNAAFNWRDLAAQFRAIPGQDYSLPNYDPRKLISVTLTEYCEDWHPGPSDRAQVLYEALAIRAAIALGYPGGREGLRAWFSLLKRDSPHFHRVTESGSGGWIDNLCEASAELCVVLETRAAEEKLRISGDNQSVPKESWAEYKTPLGRNIDRLRKECFWSFEDLALEANIDKKLILNHVNRGSRPQPPTLKKYVKTFSKKLNRDITVAELES